MIVEHNAVVPVTSLERIRRLGERVGSRWERVGRSDSAFAEIAADELRATDLDGSWSALDLLREALVSDALPPQGVFPNANGKFGEPSVGVYLGDGFVIEMNFWVDGSTAIHDHSFSGAFRVLAGSSLHTVHAFTERRRIDSRFAAGELRALGSELLGEGDVRQVIAGPSFVHALFHLERPSVTLLVRTVHEADRQPLRGYDPPCFARAASMGYSGATVRIAALETARRCGLDHEALLRRTLTTRPFPEAYLCAQLDVRAAARSEVAPGASEARNRELERWMEPRHGELAALAAAAIRETVRVESILLRRRAITAIEPRFLLALLMNLRERSAILDLVRQQSPGEEPQGWILRQVDQMSRTGADGGFQLLDLAVRPRPGLPADLRQIRQAVLAGLLDRLSFEEILPRLRSELPLGLPDAVVLWAGDLYNALYKSRTLRVLFQ